MLKLLAPLSTLLFLIAGFGALGLSTFAIYALAFGSIMSGLLSIGGSFALICLIPMAFCALRP
jgi:hypothetical protein